MKKEHTAKNSFIKRLMILLTICGLSLPVSAQICLASPDTYSVSVQSGYLALRNAKAYDSRNEIGELYSGDSFQVTDYSDDTYWYGYSPKLNQYGYVNKNYLKETYSDQIDYDSSEIRIYNESETTLATVTEEPAASVPTKNDYEIWEEFLISGEYKKYISDDIPTDELEYVIYDINTDDIPEMLIQSISERPFYNTWLFVLQGESIKLANEQYGYGQYRYSLSQDAIIGSPEWRPFDGTGYSPFYRLNETSFELVFQIMQDEWVWYYIDENNKTEISEEERASYFTDIVSFEWLPVELLISAQSDHNIKTSTKTDLGQYLNTNIFDFVDVIGDMYDVGATDGSKEYSNGTIIVSAGYDSDKIQYISINSECNFSIKGIEYGMSFSDATEIATESCSYISRDLPYYKYFILKDGTSLSIYAENEVEVDAINLFSNQ